jgi:hypothetical protein
MDEVERLIAALPPDRQVPMRRLRNEVRDHLPPGFDEAVDGTSIAYTVSRAVHEAGYHVDPSRPLPFIHLASQRGHIALYHMGLYADPDLRSWFVDAYAATGQRLDMGKSCIRFRRVDTIPYEVIGELCGRMSADEFVRVYQRSTGRP